MKKFLQQLCSKEETVENLKAYNLALKVLLGLSLVTGTTALGVLHVAVSMLH